MTHRGSRVLHVGSLSRVEGEGALHLKVRGRRVTRAQLQIYEPPRFFEAFLRGRAHTEPPDITARVCGICPVAYQMSACAAIEDACGITVHPQVQELRRLLYCGEWIESQALHIYLLHAPDFLGRDSAIDLARTHRAEVERGLRLKQSGNAVMELIGGRAIHPVNVRLGGFHRAPTRAELAPLAEQLRRAADDAWQTVRWVAGFDFPDAEVDADFLALAAPGTYAIERGTPAVLRPDGRIETFPVYDFLSRVREEQVPHSTALHARLDGRRHLTGSLARFAISGRWLSRTAVQAAREAGLGDPCAGAVCRNPFRSILVRAVEIVYAIDEALRITANYEPPEHPYVEVPPVAGTGHGATEAPRGLLYHRYLLDSAGLVADARLVPPTAQNQGAIEEDLRRIAERALAQGDVGDEELRVLAERAIRNHDPCISCSTHFLDLTVDRGAATPAVPVDPGADSSATPGQAPR
ncbi:nickel-dependent hydrogenase large subunit [Streptomyces sp. TRM66268-LWL]|uniref:Nickel-dependent hydrogenase large subunit n=1 Tax=Streptomyces polyasparticus TaxID=2767826 RepID=A0ABR7SN55_9ACTN|nr:nickel-dependent hydrogenase large subunit [Streptomyces polyasparticus]MBC9715931.1 nickel-dependent hydrogenase large subunit [Streptomyces polyasparticus]